MSNSSLASYLNDHLAGSAVAIRLLRSLEDRFAPHIELLESAQTVAAVRLEIEEERAILERLISDVGTGESSLRKAAGWFAERFTRVKLAADDWGGGAFQLFEMAEVIALGITGKRGLWRALQASCAHLQAVQLLDLDALIARSDVQFSKMEPVRLMAAREALGEQPQ